MQLKGSPQARSGLLSIQISVTIVAERQGRELRDVNIGGVLVSECWRTLAANFKNSVNITFVVTCKRFPVFSTRDSHFLPFFRLVSIQFLSAADISMDSLFRLVF